MWDLKHGRTLFLSKYHFKSDKSFWWHLAGQMAEGDDSSVAEALDAARNDVDRPWMSWAPTNANCPELSKIVSNVVKKLPQEWKATGRNIFVGIAPLGEMNAQAWNKDKRGVVEINLQYYWALESYVLAFDEFRSGLTRIIDDINDRPYTPHADPAFADFVRSWNKLETELVLWHAPGVIAFGEATGDLRAPGRRDSEIDTSVSAAVEFIVAHELAHHLMGHTSSSGAKKRGSAARAIVEPLFSDDSLRERSNFRSDWRAEIEADLVAVAVISGKLDGGSDFQKAYGALIGSFVALVCATHESESSEAVQSNLLDTHPPLSVRLDFIGEAIRSWFKDDPRGSYNDHPIGLLDQLQTFCEFVILHRRGKLDQIERDELDLIILGEFLRRYEVLLGLVPLNPNARVLNPPEHRFVR